MLNIGAKYINTLCNCSQKTNQSWPEQRKRKRSQELRAQKICTFLVGLMILTFIYFCLYTKHITPDEDKRTIQSVVANDGGNTTTTVQNALETKAADIISVEDKHTIQAVVANDRRNTTIAVQNALETKAIGADVWPNMTTMGFYEGKMYAGLWNQMMVFTVLVMHAMKEGYPQILLETIKMKDTFASKSLIPFHAMWDIPHWNSYYPRLPRLVSFDPVAHDQFNPKTRKWYRRPDGNWTDVKNETTYSEPTRPKPFGRQHHNLGIYRRYTHGKTPYANVDGHIRNPAEILMLNGALQPNPRLREIINEKLSSLQHNGGSASTSKPVEYMTLHARIEPDMQRHPVCRDKKVLKLTDIFDFIQEKWPDPPVNHIFMPINRQFLESEGSEDVVQNLQKKNETVNWIAVENLRALNKAHDEGLWNGRVKVFEFGSNALMDTEYAEVSSTAGALMNFFIGVGGRIFIGSEVSSWSSTLAVMRFYRNNTETYKYLPDGLHEWIELGTIDPPAFQC